MTSAERRARQRAEMQGRILDAARELFARHGIEAVTLRKIATAIEYTPAAIYGHFTDKEALIRALCLRDCDALSARFGELVGLPPLERIAGAGRTFVRFMAENPNHFRVMFLQNKQVEEDDEMRARKGDPARDGYAFLCQAVREAIEAGLMRDGLDDAELLAQSFWAGVQGVVSIDVAFQDDPWVELRTLERRTEAVIDAMLIGFTLPGVWPPARPTRTAKTARRASAARKTRS